MGNQANASMRGMQMPYMCPSCRESLYRPRRSRAVRPLRFGDGTNSTVLAVTFPGGRRPPAAGRPPFRAPRDRPPAGPIPRRAWIKMSHSTDRGSVRNAPIGLKRVYHAGRECVRLVFGRCIPRVNHAPHPGANACTGHTPPRSRSHCPLLLLEVC